MHLTVVLCQLAYIVPSVLLYLAEIMYLIQSRDPQFTSAFHSIFLLRAPADFVQVTVSLVTFRFPLSGWRAVLPYPWIAKAGFMTSQFSCLLELFAQLLLSVNRLTAIAFPLTHRWMWSPRSMCLMFLICGMVSLVPTAIRLPQPADYFLRDGRVLPRLLHEEDQRINSLVSCVIYIGFCLVCFILNSAAVWVLAKQRKEKLFDQQHRMAIRVQTNLLIYSCSFTVTIMAMTAFQCLLALQWFPVESDWYPVVVFCLTMAADSFALFNPWLLLLLSAPFRKKFLSLATLTKMFTDRSTVT